MRGKSIAWSDPNTTSGYLVPSYELHQRGTNPSTFFSRQVLQEDMNKQ